MLSPRRHASRSSARSTSISPRVIQPILEASACRLPPCRPDPLQQPYIALFGQRQHLALGGSSIARHTPQLLARRLRIDTYPHAMAAQRHQHTPRHDSPTPGHHHTPQPSSAAKPYDPNTVPEPNIASTSRRTSRSAPCHVRRCWSCTPPRHQFQIALSPLHNPTAVNVAVRVHSGRKSRSIASSNGPRLSGDASLSLRSRAAYRQRAAARYHLKRRHRRLVASEKRYACHSPSHCCESLPTDSALPAFRAIRSMRFADTASGRPTP